MSKKITADDVRKMLAAKGLELTAEQTDKILPLLRKFARIIVEEHLKEAKTDRKKKQ